MSAEFEKRRARLVEYVPWMMRDYFTNQGPSTALVVLLIGVLSLLPIVKGATGVPVNLGDVPPAIATRVLHAMLPPLVFLGTFFATNGIIANDRKFAYYRFLFAKPVSPPRYYAMTFLIYGLGLVAVSLGLLGLWALAVRPMFPIQFFLIVPLMYLAYGGIGFLLSAAWRFDWVSLVMVLFVANVGWSVWGNETGLRHWLLYLLPPVHRAEDVYAMILHEPGSGTPWQSIAWLAGYGLICFAFGLLVIRKRPLGTS
jgi:hypothetical protein